MFKLIQTSGACPEQYDVYLEDNPTSPVGYMRLRHGYFYAECRGETVYEASPKGDGCFEYDERERYLNAACYAIKKAMDKPENKEIIYEIKYE